MITENNSISPNTKKSHPAPIGNIRWQICALLFFSTAINYIDRQILGILKPQLSHDLMWSEHDYANIVATFQCTYAFGYLFGGRLIDRFGAKKGLSIASIFWSIACAAHGVVRSAFGFCCARFGLGLAEGCNFPAAIKTVSEWFPIKERALATGIFNSACNVGAIICPLTIPWIAVHAGWPFAFFVTGALGLIWVVAWVVLYDNPEMHPGLKEEEREYIEQERNTHGETSVPWASLLGLKTSWAYMLANIFATPVWWFYLFWIPDFLHKKFLLTLEQTGFYTSVIYGISIAGSIFGGWFAEFLIEHGWSLNASRKMSLLVPAVCVLPICVAASVSNIWISVAVVGLAAAAHQAWSANLYTFVSDVTPKKSVSSVVGLGGFTSGIASMIVAQVVGFVLTATNSYVPLFAWASTMYILSLLIIHILVPKIEDFNSRDSLSTGVTTDEGDRA
jgi:ACS family hexuronate transporter-like MFS transporter